MVNSARAISSPDLRWPISAEIIDFAEFRDHLRQCEEKHIQCQKASDGHVADLAVIDCQTRQIIPAPPDCEYVALSYVLGASGSISIPQKSILQPHLDATIEDALIATRQLGFKYIWIDRYCISEEEKDSKSRSLQIEHMHLIYQNAQLTIVAAAGDDVTFGLPGVGDNSRTLHQKAIGPGLLSNVPLTSYELLRRSKWMSRAWTLQEAIFSRRRLIFTEQRLFLQCRHTEFAETSRKDNMHLETGEAPSQLEKRRERISFGADDGIRGLVEAIRMYSRRELTYESDALRAF